MDDREIKTVILKVNGEDAEKGIQEIKDKLDKATDAKKALYEKNKGKLMDDHDKAQITDLNKEIRKCQRELGKMGAGADEVTRTLNKMEQATPKELQRTLRALKQSLSGPHMQRGSKEWKAIQERIKDVKEEIEKVNAEQKAAMSMSDRFAEWGQKWMGIAEVVETSAEAFSGIKASASEAYDAYLQMDEAQSQVRKYTGLTTEAVAELNDVFKAMDTRTPREKLNALAADAGRLGITSKESIVQFVEAANMLNVALGEDLGEDAVKNIGKLAQLFDDDQRMGLKQAMISTGSVINELAQTSSADEAYIMDFTARLAGMAKQASMSQAQVMALAAVMDQAMVNAEEGSTALMKVIQQIYREPEKMAKAAGLEVANFTKLVKTDANEALLQFATAVSKLGGMEKIAPMLGDLSLTGAGVSKAIATLANDVDKVRASQVQATAAFASGTSVLNEYNTANNTATAQQEKRKKQMEDLRIELGEKLVPLMSTGLHTTTEMIKASAVILDFGAKHIASLAALTISITAFVAVANRAVIAEKAMALWTGICDKAQKLWAATQVIVNLSTIAFTKGLKAARIQFQLLNASMKTNIFGLVAAAISAVVVGLVEFINREKEAVKTHSEVSNSLKRINDAMTDSTQKEITRVKRLAEMVTNSAYSYDTKKAAMMRLQSIIPGFHAALGKELTLTKENTTAINDYIKGLENKAKAQAYYEEIVDLEKKVAAARRNERAKEYTVEAVNAELQRNPKLYASKKEMVRRYLPNSTSVEYTRETNENLKAKNAELDMRKKLLKQAQDERAEAERTLATVKKQLAADKEVSGIFDSLIIGKKNTETTVTTTGSGLSDDKLKAAVKAVQAAAEQKKLLRRMEYENGIIDYETYTKALLNIDAERYLKERNLHQKNSAEWLEAENKRLDVAKKLKDADADYSLHQIEVDAEFDKNAAQQRFIQGTINEKEYQKEITRIHLEELKKRAVYLLAYSPGSPEQIAAQKAYQDAYYADKLQKHQEYLEKVKEFEAEYNKKTNAQKMADEIKFLDEMISKGDISPEKRAEYLKQIQDKYNKKESSSSALGGSMDPISSGVINIGTAISNLEEKLRSGKATWQDYAAVAVASLGMISTLANSASQLMQANIDVETAKINRKYDSEINAAGRNSQKAKKLEEKKQAELAKVKNKYATKAMAMQMAGAVAQTAVSAINAYSSAAAIPIVGHVLAPIAAAAAIAAGMVQIAVIKKQQEAQSLGYYQGGYTRGNRYHREAGVVHEGEFVGNHEAVNNPHIRPFFDIIDYAQRHNFVNTLTNDDVSHAIAAPQRSAAALNGGPQTIVISETEATTEQLERLNDNLEKGTIARVVMDEFDNDYRKYKNLKKNK